MDVKFISGPEGKLELQDYGTFYYATDTKALYVNNIKLTSGIPITSIIKLSDLKGTYFQNLYDTLNDNYIHLYYVVNDVNNPFLLTTEAEFIGAKFLNTGDLIFFGKPIINDVITLVKYIFTNNLNLLTLTGSGEWGSIIGNIKNQTDLQDVLNSIINDCSESATNLKATITTIKNNLQTQMNNIDDLVSEQWLLIELYELLLEEHRLRIALLEADVNSGILVDAITHSFISYSDWVILTKPDTNDKPTDISKLRKNVIYYIYDDEDGVILYTVNAELGILTMSGVSVYRDSLIFSGTNLVEVNADGTVLKISKA